MQRNRPPWWLYPAVAATVLHFLLIFVAEFYGPDSPGWQLKNRPQSYLVTAITPGSPAARAGIQPGDVLLQWDGIPLSNNIVWFMSRTGPGQTHRLEVERGGGRHYISPEQLRGEPPTERWDLWALAVVAYEMLTGAYPFATAAGDWRQNLLSARVIPTRVHVPDAADSWDRFFADALAPDPAQRPASAARFLTAFEREILPAAHKP